MNYLEVLQNIPDPPPKLFTRGNLPSGDPRPKTVAIVGSRRNTSYGGLITQELAATLAKEGVIIVSGLAYGIDSIAHRACLDAGGRTIAILGTPIDKIYPVAHRALAHRILQKGAIISEHASGEIVYPKTSFLYRNRLISGLSDAVVIVEAAERSGTLSTAAHALNQGREVFAVPGDITRLNSVGCNRLINQGARVYTGPEDVLNFLFPKKKSAPKRRQLPLGDNEVENHIIKSIAEGTNDGEELIKELNLSVSEFNQTITMLELKGTVRALGFNRWTLIC